MPHTGLGASSAQVTEHLDDQAWRRFQSWKPRRSAPQFVKGRVQSYSLDGTEGAADELEDVVWMPSMPKKHTTGNQARQIYKDVLQSGTQAVATTSAVTLDDPLPLKADLKGKSVAVPIDLDEEEEVEEDSAVDEEDLIRHCEVCAVDVTDSRWREHTLSLPHLLARDAETPASKLPPHIAIKEHNPGRRILHGQGWAVGEGLGVTGDGRPTPLKPLEKHDRLGIGLKRKAGPDKPPPPSNVSLHESVAARAKRHKQETQSWVQLYSHISRDHD